MKNPWNDINIEEAKAYQKEEELIREILDSNSVTFETAVDLLSRIDEYCDQEYAHIYADKVLCILLNNLGHKDIVDAYNKIGKWYA